MKYIIEQIGSVHCAYMHQVGAYGQENHALMKKLKHWARVHQLLNDNAVIYAVARDNARVTTPEHCRYDVGIVLEEVVSSPDVQFGTLFQAGTYMVFTIEHTAQAVGAFWKQAARMLQEKKCMIDRENPILERYQVRMVNNGLCEMCIPIQAH